jgi:hypothetical protein
MANDIELKSESLELKNKEIAKLRLINKNLSDTAFRYHAKCYVLELALKYLSEDYVSKLCSFHESNQELCLRDNKSVSPSNELSPEEIIRTYTRRAKRAIKEEKTQ